LQAILDDRARADQAHAVGDQSTQVTCAGIGDPHAREAIVFEEIEQMPSIATIGLCLAHDHGSDLSRLAHEDSVAELVHEGVEPLGISGSLDADGHWPRQGAVELLDGIAVVGELLLEDFARGGVENGHLLLSRVQITSDECHESGLLFGGRVTVPQPNPINSGRPFS
jgi:hypothetical protein